ncbi:MAG: outer membrane beta-barrel protein [Acidobacteriota bacterium]
MKRALMVLSTAVFISGMAAAQDEFSKFTFNAGAGFTTPVKGAGDVLDRGWNAGLGAGVNFHPNFGLLLEGNYNRMGINSATLNALSFPGGNVSVWSATLNPIIRLNPRGPVDAYFIGGAGLYQWRNQFTAPTVTTVTGFNPFLGVFYPVAVPATQVLTDYSVNKFGFNGGMGFTFGGIGHGKARFYSEARFHRMMLSSSRHMDMVPVTFGIRF